MRPERWQEVERLYYAALERDPELRPAFLAEAAGNDEELLGEVKSLLEQSGSDSRLDRPIWEPGAESSGTRLIAGTQMGQYKIEGPLGAGGMGEVFRARDTRLNRTVAIKISKQRFTGRFKREAQAVAALNHPNIVQIYGLESADGGDFIVMELVTGRTLAELLSEKPLLVDEAMACAHQIASALAAAHTAGIVHRDIKPANIIVDDAAVVKILDFGLATQGPGSASGDGTVTVHSDTAAGKVLGTPSYMSPEQAEGKPVNVRSDIFSTGAVLYEMFTGTRAFVGDSTFSILGRVVHDTPARIHELRPEVPPDVERVICHCLEKDPTRRYPSGRELASALLECSRPAPPVAPTARVRAAIATVLLTAIATAGWLYYRNQGSRWARHEALPKIQALILQSDYVGAFALTRTALRNAPDDPQLKQHWANVSLALTMTTAPPGATISIRPFGGAVLAWERVGKTPLDAVRVPFANVRMRIENDGIERLEFAAFTPNLQGQEIRLYPRGTIPDGMVPVPEHASWTAPVKVMPLPDYFVDKFEVTNRQFQRFVDSGGYRAKKYWRYPFLRNGREVPFEQALAGFRDSTGREGPSVWELGAFPKDQANYPVAGVSWFEAAAYCEAEGKALPTVHHWQKAAGFGIFSDILLFSNFTHNGPMRVGANPGITPSGAYDMAGNVKEWVQNEAGNRRVILGGAFNEPGYTFHDLDAQDPFARLSTFGIRCASFPTPVPEAALSPIARVERDYSTEKPVGNETFEIFRRMYAYDRTPLDAKTESVDNSNEVWRKETVSYAAAYGGERIPAYLFLPKNVKPPYQTVLWVPGGYALFLRSSLTGATTDAFDFLVRTGRAVLYPVYKGTFERRVENLAGPNAYRESMIQLAKDASRSVDYLETRSDIQTAKLGYYGISLGGTLGPVLLALDPRLRAGVLLSGGLYGEKAPPEIDILNFAPRVGVPVLMLGGRYDFATPPTTLQQPMFRLLGTREPDKRFIQFDAGHVPPLRDVMRETLNWLDHYLGPVTQNAVADRQP
jgi:eukaryotic-like serine/threonine-protein kinase